MEKIPATLDGLTRSLNQIFPLEHVLEKLRNQLEKDFAKSNIALNLSDYKTASDFIPSIQQSLKSLNSSQLQQLLYLIDLPEKLYVMLLDCNDNNLQLAQNIVYREFVKVYYQLHFQA